MLLELNLCSRQRSAKFHFPSSTLRSISPVESSAFCCNFVWWCSSSLSSGVCSNILQSYWFLWCCKLFMWLIVSLFCSQGAGLQVPGATELPVCTVCLERMVRCWRIMRFLEAVLLMYCVSCHWIWCRPNHNFIVANQEQFCEIDLIHGFCRNVC